MAQPLQQQAQAQAATRSHVVGYLPGGKSCGVDVDARVRAAFDDYLAANEHLAANWLAEASIKILRSKVLDALTPAGDSGA